MMFKGKTIFDASFDVYAKQYHQVRPGYPSCMYEDIRSVCGITSSSRILEIGVGSGIATKQLATFGCELVGLEPGSQLVAIAKRELATFPKVQIEEKTFEDFHDAGDGFDAVLALTAFHWLSSEDKYQKVMDLLRQNGTMVIVWNSFCQSGEPVSRAVNDLYTDLLPDVYPTSRQDVNEGVLAKLTEREHEIQNDPRFVLWFLRRYLTLYHYDSESYASLLNTYPKIIKLENSRREAFLAKVRETVKGYGSIHVPVLTTLLVCRRKADVFQALSDESPKEILS